MPCEAADVTVGDDEEESLRRSRCASSEPMRWSIENLEDFEEDEEEEEEEEGRKGLVSTQVEEEEEEEDVTAAAAAAAAAAEVMTAAAAADVNAGSNSRFCAATIACSAIFRCSLKMRLDGGGGGG